MNPSYAEFALPPVSTSHFPFLSYACIRSLSEPLKRRILVMIVTLLCLTAPLRTHRNVVVIVCIQTSENRAEHAAICSSLVMIKSLSAKRRGYVFLKNFVARGTVLLIEHHNDTSFAIHNLVEVIRVQRNQSREIVLHKRVQNVYVNLRFGISSRLLEFQKFGLFRKNAHFSDFFHSFGSLLR